MNDNVTELIQKLNEFYNTMEKGFSEWDSRIKSILQTVKKLEAMNFKLPSPVQVIEYFKGTHRNALRYGWLLPLSGFSLGNFNAVRSLALNNPERLSQQLCQYLSKEDVIERMYKIMEGKQILQEKDEVSSKRRKGTPGK